MTNKRYLILDRDGTMIIDKNYLSSPEDVEFIKGVPEALAEFIKRGWGILVITNQSGVGRGFFTMHEVDAVNTRLAELLLPYGVKIDGFYVCPHLPEDACDCRKPNIGLITQAVADYGFDPTQAIVVGDKASDIELGKRVGATTVLVGVGGQGDPGIDADLRLNTLAELPSATIAFGSGGEARQ